MCRRRVPAAFLGLLVLALFPLGVEGADQPDLAGQWILDLTTDDEGNTSELVLDIGAVGERWIAEFDLLDFGVENYPVKVVRQDGVVQMFLTAIGSEFTGEVSEDGGRLSGTGRRASDGETESLEFRRVATEPSFSADFMALETAADDPSLVEVLGPDAKALRERFNEDADRTRLLMLLSPT